MLLCPPPTRLTPPPFFPPLQIFERKGHCVVCVAEGAGQDILNASGEQTTDASGNPILQVGRGGRGSAIPPGNM